jgi:hypothetical protein
MNGEGCALIDNNINFNYYYAYAGQLNSYSWLGQLRLGTQEKAHDGIFNIVFGLLNIELANMKQERRWLM